MDHRDDYFSPESVNEQIERFLETPHLSEPVPSSPAEVLQQLEGIYHEESRLQRVWERLADKVPTAFPSQKLGEEQMPHAPLVRLLPEQGNSVPAHTPRLEQRRARSSFQRHLGLLVAVFIMAVLVGSLALVLPLAHRTSTGHTQTSSGHTSPQATPSVGQVISSVPVTNAEAFSVAWSADGERIAVSGNPTLIWDALTGKHPIALPSSASSLALPVWSPTGELLAVPTTNSILIVDGQSGKTIASYPMPVRVFASTPVSTTGRALSAFLPLGGAPTFGGISWSPDGKWIASTFSSAAAEGLVQVWNPQTGQVALTLSKQAGTAYGAISWSSDGKYLAAHTWKWLGGVQQINVWSLQTHGIVFQQSVPQGLSGVSWQPGTDNLASALLVPGSDSNLPGPPVYNTATLKLWNVLTGQVITTIPGVDGSNLAWSPDGQQIAYTHIVTPTSDAGVTILDVRSGQKIYTYQVTASKGHLADLSTPAWSPDGTYIVTIAFGPTLHAPQPTPTTQPQSSSEAGMVQVWVA